METIWEFFYNKLNGMCDIFRDGELFHPKVPYGFLEAQLMPHRITKDEIEDIRRQLAETGKAVIRVPQRMDTFRQIG